MEMETIELLHCVAEIGVTYKRTKQPIFKVECSKTTFEYCLKIFQPDTIEYRESFKVIYLDVRNNVIGYSNLFEGSCKTALVDVKMIFQGALICNANGIIIAHNHPSGNISPSKNDLQISKQVKDAGKILGVELIDSLIITKDNYYSLMDNYDI